MKLPSQSVRTTEDATERLTRGFELPTQRTGPPPEFEGPLGGGSLGTGSEPAHAPSSGTAPHSRRRRVVYVSALVSILALSGGAMTVTHLQQAQAAESARHAGEVKARAQVFAGEQRMLREQNMVASWAQTLAERAAAVAAAGVSVEAARAALAATPQAGDDLRNAFQAAIDAASAVVTAIPSASVLTIQAAVAAIAGPQQAATDAQVAWQAAEDARIVAEQAAAQAAADAAARSAAAKAAAPRTTTTPRAARSATAAPAAAAAPTTNVPEFSAGALGGAINAFRASQGLPALGVSRSAGLVAHAGAMAQAGSIWHSGNDKIVGYVQPASAADLVQAWANSPGHRAWMVRTDVSAMQVGAVVLNDRLFGAVNFT